MPAAFSLGAAVELEDLAAVASNARRVVLNGPARKRAASSRRKIERSVSLSRPVYGVNTGFGQLACRRVAAGELKTLQRNLVLSHACAVGPLLEEQEARAILFLRANELARGFSGVRPQLIEMMARLINAGAAPAIPSRGSVGASGDLAPQAHMALLLIGEGEAFWKGRKIKGAEALRRCGVKAAVLEAKEGLALLNGTQAMQAVGGLALRRALMVFSAAQLAGAMSLEALTGTPVAFDEALQRLKPHPGQLAAARQLRRMLAGSEICESHRDVSRDRRVQDAYSLRCMPQVHGAALDTLGNSRRVLETELRSVTDNPLVVGARVLSGGNFHGQALSFSFDFAAIAVAALGNIAERRIAQLISGRAPKLKSFLAHNPGLESGWMIPQVVAASLASENKGLAHPASVDSIPTSEDKEDFVSMGMGAALKFKQVVFNAAQIVAIELLCAAEGLQAHAPLKPGQGVRLGLKLLRAQVPAGRGDEILGPRMEKVRELILSGYFQEIDS
ncbi:MAG: histidine ammonia-lyase [Elusimicrobia bacterium RIFCSPHIGHO2_02_FULL_57_9]|nr:MAG: histidine ammonia-lyase [Elusimicrobia bacterium RIFCSPHIGHO2_02_FULL_57_9]